jgi:integrase
LISKITMAETQTQGLELSETSKEGLLVGTRSDGKKYSVREHRQNWFTPDVWKKLMEALPTRKSRLTADVLIQTGARINEARHIASGDLDYDRRTIKLRITKAKARKGEKKGKPRTIPISTEFTKVLKKYFKELPADSQIGLLSTPAFNTALKNALQEIGVKDWYMFSAHNIRKTHGNWLKIMGNLRMMNIDATEICLRLGHDYNTFLKNYGSAGVLDSRDVLMIREILGDLYQQ